MTPCICVYQCPKHPNIVSVVVERQSGAGTRILGGKCCPSQYARKLSGWRLTDRLYDEIAYEMAAALEEEPR